MTPSHGLTGPQPQDRQGGIGCGRENWRCGDLDELVPPGHGSGAADARGWNTARRGVLARLDAVEPGEVGAGVNLAGPGGALAGPGPAAGVEGPGAVDRPGAVAGVGSRESINAGSTCT